MAEQQQSAAQQPREPKKIVAISESRMSLHESRVLRYHFIADANTSPDDILEPAFWAHVAAKFQEYSELVVYREDWAWRADLVVREAGANWAKVELIDSVRFGEHEIKGQAGIVQGYSIKWAGSFAKWRVIRDADGQVICEKHNTKGDAEAWLVDYSKGLKS